MKIKPTARYLNEQREKPDYVRSLVKPTDTPPNRRPVPRLSFSSFTQPLPFTYDAYVTTITESALRNHVFFLDTCFIKKEVPQSVWEALATRTICITHWVDYELREWKASPKVNVGFHSTYINAQQHGDDAVRFLPSPDSDAPVDVAIRHYAGLLGLRKRVFTMVRKELMELTGKSPSDEVVHARVQSLVKERGMKIATKGSKDSSKPNLLADEYLVVQAFAYALSTGCDVTVLTRDHDLSEQFYKTQYLLDTHYRSLLLADAYIKQPLNFEKLSGVSAPFPCFETMELYRMPAGMEHRVLSDEYRFVNVHVDHIVESGSDLGITSSSFAAETEMLDVLIAKGKTAGLNTSALGELNLHRCVHPSLQSDLGSCIAITKDRFIGDQEERWPAVDVDIVLTQCERGAAIKSHEIPLDAPSKETLRQAIEISRFRVPQRLTPTFSLDYINTSASSISVALEMMEPWTRFLVSAELISELPSVLKDALATHDCDVLPSRVRTAHDHGLKADAVYELSEMEGRKVLDYYIALLSHRKMFGRVCAERLQKSSGNYPTRRQIQREVISYCDPCCWLRASDYLDRTDDPHVFDDERLVADAFLKAAWNGRETVILTRRRELVDQFWTMARTLEGHFRAWAIAKTKLDFFKRQPVSEAGFKNCFKSNTLLCNFNASEVHAAMPQDSLEITVQVWLLSGDLNGRFQVYPVGFAVEPAMTEMFRCKQECGLSSVEGIDGRNVHFQWAHTSALGTYAQCWLGVDEMVRIGSTDFPHDPRLSLSVSEVPAFDLILTTTQDREIPFPWAKAEQVKKRHEDRKRERKRRIKKPR